MLHTGIGPMFRTKETGESVRVCRGCFWHSVLLEYVYIFGESLNLVWDSLTRTNMERKRGGGRTKKIKIKKALTLIMHPLIKPGQQLRPGMQKRDMFSGKDLCDIRRILYLNPKKKKDIQFHAHQSLLERKAKGEEDVRIPRAPPPTTKTLAARSKRSLNLFNQVIPPCFVPLWIGVKEGGEDGEEEGGGEEGDEGGGRGKEADDDDDERSSCSCFGVELDGGEAVKLSTSASSSPTGPQRLIGVGK